MPMLNNSTITLLQDIRRLLRYHRSVGITNYPAKPELDGFLHPRPGFSPPKTPGQNTFQPQGEPATVSLADIREELQGCNRCNLCKSRTNIVFGQGSERPNLLIVTEWPGSEDDQQGKALCAQAGELLTRMLAAIKLTRKDIFVTHTVKCLPPGNRAPEADEVKACLAFLHRQIEVLKPRIICTMGPLAARALLKTDDSFFRLRGRFHDFQTIQGETLPLLPTFHPAFLLKNPEMKKASWQDLQMLQKRLT